MGSLVCAILIILLVGDKYEGVVATDSDDKESFDKYYEVMWGSNNYVLPFDHGKQVQLSLDNCSGSLCYLYVSGCVYKYIYIHIHTQTHMHAPLNFCLCG